MSEAHLKALDDKHFELSGVLDFQSVPKLWRVGHALFEAGHELHVDLGGVSHSNSAGLALLVEWLRFAEKREKSLRYHNIPPQMLAIARVSDLEKVLARAESA